MNNFLLQTTFIALVFSCTFTSCISKQKYTDVQDANDRYRKQVESLQQRGREYQYTTADMNQLKEQVSSANEKVGTMQTQYQTQLRYAEDIERRYNELLEQNRLLLNASSSETNEITAELAACRVERDAKIRELNRLQLAIGDLQNQLNEANNRPAENCDEYRRQVNELNTLLSNKDQALLNLRTKVNKALLGFSASDLTVTESNGKIYVSLSQDLLFASGSDQIDWKGKSAIGKLGEVLKANPDIKIMVEGHTDSDGSANENWDLSVRRATSVVKVLTASGVAPKNITAAGRALYLPIASNNTTAGKAKNRRTEIILTPNLDDLYKLINQ